jgi:hypothetical protein
MTGLNLIKKQASIKCFNPLIPLLLAILLASCGSNEHKTNLLEDLLSSHPTQFSDILNHKDQYEIQIIYTQIDRDENNQPHFTVYTFNVDSGRYFYPASTVKLPAVMLALEKINKQRSYGIDEFTPVFHDSVYSGQLSVTKDSTSENGLPSIAHYCKKILVTSDNDAFNRLYEYLGQRYFNERLSGMGYAGVRVQHRLERFLTRDQNRHTEAIRFVKNNSVVLSEPMKVNTNTFEMDQPILRGKAFYRNDSLIQSPFNFTYKNAFPLTVQQEILKSIVFPSSVAPEKRFGISDAQRKFVLKYMSQLPDETFYPAYFSDTTYNDGYAKFFIYGGRAESIPEDIRIFNKIGNAYGYLIDNAYIVDFPNGVEFMLSAVINVNTDQIYNDDKDDYENLGFPFMKNLGNVIYNYELKRKRDHKPDLREFKFEYDR